MLPVRIVRVFVWLVVATIVAGCAKPGDVKKLKTQLAELRDEVAQFKQSHEEAMLEVAAHTEELLSLQDRLEGDLREAKGEADVLRHDLRAAKDELESLQSVRSDLEDLKQRVDDELTTKDELMSLRRRVDDLSMNPAYRLR